MNENYTNLISRVSLIIAPFFLFGLINGMYNSAIADNPLMFWSLDMLGWVVLPSTILVYLYRFYGIGLRDYGLGGFENKRHRREILNWSILSTFILAMYYFAFNWLAWRFIDISIIDFSYAQMLPEGRLRIIAVIYLALTAAVFEEIFFRGLIWRLVYASSIQANKAIVYTITSALLFGLVHWENGLAEVFATMVFGVVACILYLRLRNLIPLMVAHFTIDLVHFW